MLALSQLACGRAGASSGPAGVQLGGRAGASSWAAGVELGGRAGASSWAAGVELGGRAGASTEPAGVQVGGRAAYTATWSHHGSNGLICKLVALSLGPVFLGWF